VSALPSKANRAPEQAAVSFLIRCGKVPIEIETESFDFSRTRQHFVVARPSQ
jgi:hypothetical protein